VKSQFMLQHLFAGKKAIRVNGNVTPTASDQASGCGGRWSLGALFTHLPSVLRREKGTYLQESNSLILPRHQPKTPVFRVA
jgi:hypothetical protein